MLFDGNLVTESAIRQKIRDFYRIDENLAVEHILPDAEVNASPQPCLGSSPQNGAANSK